MSQPHGDEPDNNQPTTRFRAPDNYGPQYGSQQQYPQQGYGQPQYPQQGSGQTRTAGGSNTRSSSTPQRQYPQQRYSAANAYGAPVDSGAKFGVVGTTLAGIGAVVLIIAFVALDWFKAKPSHLSDVSNNLDNASSGAAGLASTYFGWLAWLLAILLVVVAIGANLPTAASGPLRALGAVLAAAAVALTFFAIKLDAGDIGYLTYLKAARAGFYVALAGFVIAGIGALIGPTRA